jgi:adenylate cyclase
VAGALKFQDRDYIIQGGRKKVAVLFADIRGFTPMTESLQPEQVVEILNQHFTAATEAINRHGGKVNKFIGDAVMALFEEPPAYKEGASATNNAIQAGLEMQAKWEMAYPQWQAKIKGSVAFGLGAGVHSGTVILGNIGSDERLEYTAIGDTVNLTARICSLAKDGEVLASEEAWNQVGGQFEAWSRPPVAIKGKTGLYTTYLMGRKVINR